MPEPAPPRPVVLTAVLAGVVIVGALVTAVLLRPDVDLPVGEEPAQQPTSVSSTSCGDDACRVLASASVNGMTVELLADSDGGTGRLRAGGPASGSVSEVSITAMGVRLNHGSLRCAQTETPVCLVRGPHDGGMAGEVHVWRGDSWRPAQRPYFSDAGNIVLDDVVGDAAPEVVVVRHECSETEDAAECQLAPVLAEVFDLGGEVAGCTGTYGSPGSLRGWPDVDVESYELAECP
ncbi:hypothetical protein DI005_02265 [Prauserella sp. PE36]|uniref:Serine/threonine protein kinase n=1 Tax=Prauserella endophytica TaxID=1592324 RepID=A0ABY2RYN6_9PSEU|nr:MULTISPECIES: hypothetical protein [Prauserella]RBM23548.1 hypothetical protein DI005_02265 [Prauserella sp. PE36]TKG64249.1 hypothetical protein FCN18_28975 [Prauserella endophytica]